MAYSVRWDRLGRIALLVVLAGVLTLYVGPAWSYWETWRESRARNAELTRLEAEHDRLLARRKALREPASLMREARRLGMVRRGERAFVVQDLPR
ncbi:MAG: septum formation initiator family protein [Actinomycetota bacterium]|nr:septum formation initiator family protein [Actinomycetota bacterium]